MKSISKKLIDIFFWVLKWAIIMIIAIAIIYVAWMNAEYSIVKDVLTD
ncbi:hypothetical protein [Winogradskyella sp. PE311]